MTQKTWIQYLLLSTHIHVFIPILHFEKMYTAFLMFSLRDKAEIIPTFRILPRVILAIALAALATDGTAFFGTPATAIAAVCRLFGQQAFFDY